jgi:hypothetical protein
MALNRLSQAIPKTAVYSTPAYTGGTEIYKTLLLGKKHESANSSVILFFYLAQNVPYVYLIQNLSTSTANVSVNFTWTEQNIIAPF